MQDTDRTMDRHYKAFISYRHKPLDMEYAIKLHRRIERYTIPSDLRKEGEKKLGLVFRDQDELPISNNLTQNIVKALDHSEYLIVVCSPDTPGSEWVRREIDYFIQTHDRDHVLALLIDGTPEESFPSLLTEIRDEKGDLTERIEPLAANITAKTPGGREKLFKTESLRILASLIGCPYDALYRREQRYKMQRLAAASAAAALILSAFIGVLLDRNAKIAEQLRNTKINESAALAALSESDFREGDYRPALEKALNAPPGRDPGRPYSPAAEYALAKELYLYHRGNQMRYTQSFEQDTEILKMTLSADGKLLATLDRYGQVRVSDAGTGSLLWEVQTGAYVSGLAFVDESRLLVNTYGARVYEAEGGSLLWKAEGLAYGSLEGREACLFLDSLDQGIRIRKADLRTGETLAEITDPAGNYIKLISAELSPDGRYAAALYASEEGDRAELRLYDFQDQSARKAGEYLRSGVEITYTLDFSPSNALVLTACGEDDFLEDQADWDGCFMELLDPEKDFLPRFHISLDPGTAMHSNYGIPIGVQAPDFIGFGSDRIFLALGNHLSAIGLDQGETLWMRELPGFVEAAALYANDSMGLVLSTGDVTVCTGEGTLSLDVNVGVFGCGYELSQAAAGGTSYRRTCFAVVSRKNPYRVSAIGFCEGRTYAQGADLEEFPFPGENGKGVRLLVSPSERYLAGIQEAESGYTLTLLDLTGEKEPASYTPGNIRFIQISGSRNFVTDDGKVILGGWIIDVEKKEERALTADGKAPQYYYGTTDLSCILQEEGSVLTGALTVKDEGGADLLLWKDGREEKTLSLLPESAGRLDEGRLCALYRDAYALLWIKASLEGPGQYLLASLEDGTITEMPCLDPEKEETLAMADLHPWMALQKEEGDLSLIDLESRSEICRLDSPLPASGVVKLLFAREDQWLLAFTNSGGLAVFDTEDGHLLYQRKTLEENLRFDSDSRYSVCLVPEQNRLLILYDNWSYSESVAISLDTNSFEINGLYNGFAACLKTRDLALIVPAYDRIYQSPLLSVDKIQEMGEVLLEKGLPPAK